MCAQWHFDVELQLNPNLKFQLTSEVLPTLSPAMDILQPYNVERILLMASDFDFELVKSIMDEFEKDPNAGTKIPEQLLDRVKETIVGKPSEILKRPKRS